MVNPETRHVNEKADDLPLGRQAVTVSANADILTQQSTSISATVHDIADYTRGTARLVDSLASMMSSMAFRSSRSNTKAR